MKSESSIDRIIQVDNIDIGQNIARLRKSMNIKQTDMVAKLQTNGVDVSIYSYNRIEVRKIPPCRFCMPAAISWTAT